MVFKTSSEFARQVAVNEMIDWKAIYGKNMELIFRKFIRIRCS